jgi:hypothetical protein
MLQPKGRMKIARRFNGGKAKKTAKSPQGMAECFGTVSTDQGKENVGRIAAKNCAAPRGALIFS